MRVLITGGGTGGHIYPALAIAKGIKEKKPEAQVLYVGTSKGMEAKLVPREGFPFRTVTVEGLTRKFSVKTVLTLLKTVKGCYEAFRIIKDFKPTLVIGTGGYVCGPVVAVAAVLKIPTLIHEQNAYPGITNKILARLVDKVAVTFPESKKYFKGNATIIETGLPVRPEIKRCEREKGLEAFGFDGNRFTLLAVGGSRGARSINKAMVELTARLCGDERFQIIHMTGHLGYEEAINELKEKGIDVSRYGNITVVPYLYNMNEALSVADLVVCRAGAATIAEITVKGLPAILVPYPYASDNHQEYNAQALVNNGAAVMILDKHLTGDRLYETVLKLYGDKTVLKKMAENTRKLGKPNALDFLLKIAEELNRE